MEQPYDLFDYYVNIITNQGWIDIYEGAINTQLNLEYFTSTELSSCPSYTVSI